MKGMQDELLHGVELLNAQRFYDAHEVLEDVWRASPPETKRFYQGLVQIAVAMHHYSRSNLNGARSVHERACRNLAEAPEDFAALDIHGLRTQLAEWQACLQKGAPQPPWPHIIAHKDTDISTAPK